jgi:uncharacterized membrane protein YphA (DoxX/SURF4 family)
MQLTSIRKLLFSSSRVYLISRLVIGLLFIWAGGAKLMEPKAFARSLSQYGLVPEPLLIPTAIGLPLVEVLAGIGLIFDVGLSLSIIAGLLIAFLMILGYGIINNLDVDCGCFSPSELAARGALETAFYRDVALLLVVFYLFFWRWVRKTRSKLPDLSA